MWAIEHTMQVPITSTSRTSIVTNINQRKHSGNKIKQQKTGSIDDLTGLQAGIVPAGPLLHLALVGHCVSMANNLHGKLDCH